MKPMLKYTIIISLLLYNFHTITAAAPEASALAMTSAQQEKTAFLLQYAQIFQLKSNAEIFREMRSLFEYLKTFIESTITYSTTKNLALKQKMLEKIEGTFHAEDITLILEYSMLMTLKRITNLKLKLANAEIIYCIKNNINFDNYIKSKAEDFFKDFTPNDFL